jgi:hypothetical protein
MTHVAGPQAPCGLARALDASCPARAGGAVAWTGAGVALVQRMGRGHMITPVAALIVLQTAPRRKPETPGEVHTGTPSDLGVLRGGGYRTGPPCRLLPASVRGLHEQPSAWGSKHVCGHTVLGMTVIAAEGLAWTCAAASGSMRRRHPPPGQTEASDTGRIGVGRGCHGTSQRCCGVRRRRRERHPHPVGH